MSSARSTPVLILVFVVVAAVGIGAWFALSGGGAADLDAAHEEAAAQVVAAERDRPVELAPDEAVAPSAAPVRATASDLSVGEVVPENDELGQAIWVEGRVTIPVGTPSDERVHLYADGRAFKKSKGHRVRLGDDGRFRVAFAKGTKTGTLKLEARYLFLREPLSLKLSEVAAPLELAPELGGVIRGKIEIEAPSPELRARIPGLVVSTDGQGSGRGMFRRHANVDANLAFELQAVPADVTPKLELQCAFLVPIRDLTVAVVPGKVVEQNLRADAGKTLRARFVDESGNPVAKVPANLMPDWSKLMGESTTWVHRQQISDADGRIVMEGIPATHVQLMAGPVGYKSVQRSLDAAKEDLGAVTVTLERGLSIAGVVRWPDGSPAGGANVRWFTGTDGENFNGPFANSSTEVGADGRFEISGLVDAAYTFRASAARKVPDASASGGKPKTKRETLRGRVTDARPGAGAIEIQLGSGLMISGVAVDDLGAPLESFSVRARKHVDNGWSNDGVASHFKGGSFELDGVHEGSWKVSATAPGHARSEELRIELPGPSEGLRIVVPRECVLVGTVFNADGTPAAKAAVRWQQKNDEDGMVWGMTGDGIARCKVDGTFNLDGVVPGEGTLRAQGSDGAQSPRIPFTLAPGQSVNALVLTLEGHGEVRGTLHASIAERARRKVVLEEDDEEKDWRLGDTNRDTLSDERGDFTFLRVPAGKWTIALEPIEEARATDEADNFEWDWNERQARRMPQRIEMQAGMVASVVLGAPPGGKIRLSGRVTAGGKARDGARVTATRQTQDGEREDARTTRADGTGRYELRLEEPGAYMITCTANRGTMRTVHESFEEAADRAVDFAFGAASLAGKVTDPSGEGVGQCWLNLRRVDEAGNGHIPIYGNSQVRDDGSFSFGDLDAGSYTIDVNRWNNRGEQLADQTFGPYQLAENQALDDLELRLERAGTVVVRVSSDSVEQHSTVVFWDEDRRDFDSEWARAGRANVYEKRPGRYSVFARSGDACSQWRSVDVVATERIEVELALDCSGGLDAVITDAAGAAVPCRVRLLDERGTDVSEVVGSAAEAGMYKFRGVPPASYTVVASNNDGEIGRAQAVVGTSGTAEARIQKP
ncbi:MAG: carboxypeptidase regulatory-like domain-containing protein [Planctomycetota bacterium]|nr:MAG: carboxypeptidase regulatory-like domain-containing protein [Planctomycetota bacterium]